MARQLVFTSAPQGLTPGRTGYCTVARHGDLRERLVPMLERLSAFPSDWQPPPVICSFRMVDIAGARFPVLSRIVNAGYDYTHRGAYLAHHLILDLPETAAAHAPVEIFLRWIGWLNRWDSPPRWLADADLVDLTRLPPAPDQPLPALAWKNFTGDAGRAALLLDGSLPRNCVLRCPAPREDDVLYLLRESSALLPATERWRTEFTTCLQPAESAAGFHWVTVRANSPVDSAATRGGNVLDLTQPESLPPAPASAAARLARGEPKILPVAAAPRAQAKAAPNPFLLPDQISASPTPAASSPHPRRGVNSWILITAAGLLLGILAAVLFLWPQTPPPPPLALTPLPVSKISTPAASPPGFPAPTLSLANERALLAVADLARSGKFLDALAKWQTLTMADPDFAGAHGDVLRSQLLPGARQEWLAAVAKIGAQLESSAFPRADLVPQLAALQDLIHAWPFTNPQEMDQAAQSVLAKIQFLGRLPDAPVWIVDSLAISARGADFQDASGVISVPDLDALLRSPGGKFEISAAAATSAALPGEALWFKFGIQPDDFERNTYLILNDSSRGKAGGIFLQLLADAPGKTRLVWRLFGPDSDFVRSYPANSPLGPVSQELWLRFVGEAPLPSFYLLLRRPDGSSYKPLEPLSVPLAWLSVSGAPAKVSLPAWLGNSLLWHASPGQSLRLEPANHNLATGGLPELTSRPASSTIAAQFDAADLVNQLRAKSREVEGNLNRAQIELQNLQQAQKGPVGLRPSKAAIDQATETVGNLQRDLAQASAAAEAAAQPDWPASASPWILTSTLASRDSLTLLKFSR